MRVFRGMSVIVVVFLGIVAEARIAEAQIKVEPDPRNLIAARIEGAWEVYPEMSLELDGKLMRRNQTLQLSADPSVLEKLPPSLTGGIEKMKLRIYLAGTMKEGKRDHIFLLTAVSGMPVMVLCRQNPDGKWTEAGDAAVMIASGRDRQKDILFICQSYEAVDKEKPSIAYRRVTAAKTE